MISLTEFISYGWNGAGIRIIVLQLSYGLIGISDATLTRILIWSTTCPEVTLGIPQGIEILKWNLFGFGNKYLGWHLFPIKGLSITCSFCVTTEMSVSYGTKLKNVCPVRNSLFLTADNLFKNIKSLLNFKKYDYFSRRNFRGFREF